MIIKIVKLKVTKHTPKKKNLRKFFFENYTKLF